MLSSCQAVSFLQKDQTYLHKNKLKLISKEKIEDKTLLKEELMTFYKQNPNETILWIPRQWFYFIYKDKTTKTSKLMMKAFSQTPTFYNEEASQETAQKMESFLRDKRGFYDARVGFESKKSSQYLTDVQYKINLGNRYHINSLKYECSDPNILKIIEANKMNSFLNNGAPINSSFYDSEKIRITSLLQNNGYAQFNTDNFELKGDSSNYLVNLVLKINTDNNDSIPSKYYVGEITVFTDYYAGQETNKKLDSIKFEGINYYKQLNSFIVNPEILHNSISFRSGDLYNKEVINEVYNKLSQIAIYKFISIRTEYDKNIPNKLNYFIYCYVAENKYSPDIGASLKLVTLSEKEKFFEAGLEGSIYDRIVSDRGDNLNFGGNADIKVNFDKENLYRELNLNTKLDYNYPYPLKSVKISPLYPISSWLVHEDYSKIKNKAITKITASLDHQNFIGNYNITSLNLNFGYNYYSRPEGIQVLFNQAGVNYFASKIIDNSLFNKFQTKSMADFFQTNLLFRNLALSINNDRDNKIFFTNYQVGIELSGLELYLFNEIYDAIYNTDEIWKLSNTVEYAKFVKIDLDIRPKFRLNRNDELAGRLYMGFGSAFNANTLPYVKQFEAEPTNMKLYGEPENLDLVVMLRNHHQNYRFKKEI
ncbi:MAG: hypothetical protein R2771_06485 [Saprospiraceae bacterium]